MTLFQKTDRSGRLQSEVHVNKLAIAIDAGGTAIKLRGVKGEETVNITVNSEKGKANFFDSVVAGIRELESRFDAKVSKIVISIPGPGNGTDFIITNVAPREWINIREELAARGITCEVQGINDADAAGLGVAKFSEVLDYLKTLKGVRTNIIAMTIGTGIGLAHITATTIQDGEIKLELQKGQMGSGELHHPVEGNNGKPCNCGQIGCLETTPASTSGQVERVKQILTEFLTGRLRKPSISWSDITSGLTHSDPFCIRVMREAARNCLNGGGSIIAESVTIAARIGSAVRKTGLIREGMRDRMLRDRDPTAEMLKKELDGLTAKDIDTAASKNDPLARLVMEEGGRFLGIEAAAQVNAVEATVLVLTGGGANTPKDGLFMQFFKLEFESRVMKALQDDLKVFWIPQTSEQNLGLDGAIELASNVTVNQHLDGDGRDRTRQAIDHMGQ
ncbi:ROK family protein [Candidatus Micrarchaeota archaeon]|nr:ROK family protein [Candidatus Micrarchaeota archaeon]